MKADWENKTAAKIVDNTRKGRIATLRRDQHQRLQERRAKLSHLYSTEQAAYEKELRDLEDTPEQVRAKMAERAWALKKKREETRQKVVQEKMYQQWRAGIDDLRAADSKLFELQCVEGRDDQVREKEEREQMDRYHDQVYNQLWQENYHDRCRRELREAGIKREQNDLTKQTLDQQVSLKDLQRKEQKDLSDAEKEVLKKLWKEQEIVAEQAVVKNRLAAIAERKEADAFMAIAQSKREEEIARGLKEDKEFIQAVLLKEKNEALAELAEKEEKKRAQGEFMAELAEQMAAAAEGEELYERLQAEEMEHQWQKRYEKWELEEMARRRLMEEVYHDRSRQVKEKENERAKGRAEVESERALGKMEQERQQRLIDEQEAAEAAARKQNQEALFRQMDYHQVQRHRELQQTMIEQRNAMMAEEKMRRALEEEKRKQEAAAKEIFDRRQERKKQSGPIVKAPWDK